MTKPVFRSAELGDFNTIKAELGCFDLPDPNHFQPRMILVVLIPT